MANDDQAGTPVVWAERYGEVVGYHPYCADKLELQRLGIDRKPYHTEICHHCARFLDAPAPGSHPPE